MWKLNNDLRGYLDMYPPKGERRPVVLALIILGAVLLALGRAEGALPFGVLVWVNRRAFFESQADRFARRPWLVLAMPLAALLARAIVMQPAAADDLLRHILLGVWPEGYSSLYVNSKPVWPHAYYAFERVLGSSANLIGMVPTMWLTQAVAFAGLAVAFVGAALRVLPRTEDRAFWIAGALLLVISAAAIRISLARPEVFLSIWVISALCVRDRGAGAVAWVAAGLALSFAYWLAPIYYPAVLLLPLSLRVRFSVLVGMLLAWGIGWWLFVGAVPLEHVAGLYEVLTSRIGPMKVGENSSVINLLAQPAILLLVIAAFFAIGRPKRDLRILALIAYFCLANQVRYVSVIAPLLALFALSSVTSTRLPLNAAQRFVAVVVATFFAAGTPESVPRLAALPKFKLPDGAVVLTTHSVATYSLPFFNPGRISVAPSAEIGSSEVWLQEVIAQVVNGSLDCGAIESRGFTHFVESRLIGPAPPCLELAETEGAWRLWRVVDRGRSSN